MSAGGGAQGQGPGPALPRLPPPKAVSALHLGAAVRQEPALPSTVPRLQPLLLMPHHLRPLPFASPRHNAAVQARLAYGELLSKMAPALEDAEAAAAFPKPWASLVDPAVLTAHLLRQRLLAEAAASHQPEPQPHHAAATDVCTTLSPHNLQQLHTDASVQAMGTYLAALKGPVFRDRHDTLAAVQRMMAGEPQPGAPQAGPGNNLVAALALSTQQLLKPQPSVSSPHQRGPSAPLPGIVVGADEGRGPQPGAGAVRVPPLGAVWLPAKSRVLL
ncbi:hypothetical protein V8C86DRAFT_2926014 [Haematococcus lacustris]